MRILQLVKLFLIQFSATNPLREKKDVTFLL